MAMSPPLQPPPWIPRRRSERMQWQRFLLLMALFLLLGLALASKLLFLQTWESGSLRDRAWRSRASSLSLYNRGRILDRQGTVLAQDTLLYDVYAHPQYYRKVTAQQIAAALAPILKKPTAELARKLSLPESTIGVAKSLPKATVNRILAARIRVPRVDTKTGEPIRDAQGRPMWSRVPIPGLDFSKKNARNYPQGQMAAHILGYVNDEAGIASGVEDTAKAVLKKAPVGLDAPMFNGRGEMINVDELSPDRLVNMPKAEDVQLTIDARLQYLAERELTDGLARTKAKRGTVIMLQPQTGELLAFAVSPSYVPDQFYKATFEQLKNWATTDVYPPGSTMKILTVACGLESGVINRHSKIHDTGRMTLGGWNIQNYDYGKHGAPGMIDLVYLFQHSSNIGSAKISLMTPPETHRMLIQRFGFGSKTGLDLPGESAGILRPLSDWKDETTHANIGFGYGLAATPMQMASAVAAIANGGVWITPHVIKSQTQVVRRRVLSPTTTQTLTDLLTESISTAKTSTVRIDGVPVAGKTGTSRKPKENGRGYSNELFTSFVGFYPSDHPKVLMMVVVDSPTIAEAWGSTVAGPIFSAIAKQSLGYLGIKPKLSATPTKSLPSG